jgi:hypothetical protein
MVEKLRADVAKLLTVEIQSVSLTASVVFFCGLVVGAASLMLLFVLIHVLGLTKLVEMLWR